MQYSNNQQIQEQSQIQNTQTAVDLQLRHFKGEAYSDNEKQNYLSIMKIFSVFLVLFSFPLAAVAVYYLSIITIFFLVLLLASGICMVILGIATFSWSKNISLKIFKNQNSTSKASLASHRYSQLIFVSSISIALYNFIIIMYLYNWVQDSYDEYVAQKGKPDFQDFKQNYQVCMISSWFILVVTELILFVFIFFQFITVIGLSDLRLVAHYFNSTLIGFCLACIWSCRKAQSYLTIQSMSDYANKNQLNLVYLMSFTSLGLGIFNYFIIVRKKRQEYMWVASALILVCCIISSFNHLVYRDAQNILNGYMQTWYHEMPFVSAQYMNDEMKCNKYVTVNLEDEQVYSLHCDEDFQSLVWEDNYNLKVSERLYQTACLNQDCQGVLANSYSAWYFRLNLFILCQIASFFLIAAIFYQISLVMNRKKPGMDNVDYFFGFFTFVVVGSVLTYFYFYQFVQPPQLSEGNLQSS